MKVSVTSLAIGVALAAAPALASAQAPALPTAEAQRFAVINIQRIASESTEGKASTARVQALNQKKITELNDLNKRLQADQQKLQSQGTMLNEAARAELERSIDKMQKDLQRSQQDAQEEVQQLQQDLQNGFQAKLAADHPAGGERAEDHDPVQLGRRGHRVRRSGAGPHG